MLELIPIMESEDNGVSTSYGKKIPRITAWRKGLVYRSNFISEKPTITKPSEELAVEDCEGQFEEQLSDQDMEGEESTENRDDDEELSDQVDGDADMSEDDYETKMYEDEEFGKIVIKPWHIFTDKQHLRDDVKDYCIQNGISIVVVRADNFRWTVKCSANCGWKLHSSRLPDGVTWGIKSIRNSEHKCSGFEIKKPMGIWATKVLMEDIRDNNLISAKSMNEILWKRYEVQMAPITLYRARSRALIEMKRKRSKTVQFSKCESFGHNDMEGEESTEKWGW
ncbi:hypothetical protein SOVF_186730 [Spinacia oleracea]|nr:hypothetical protein SOVF_186730 [Spinacia oleracea]